jgi:hypothetical protein
MIRAIRQHARALLDNTEPLSGRRAFSANAIARARKAVLRN